MATRVGPLWLDGDNILIETDGRVVPFTGSVLAAKVIEAAGGVRALPQGPPGPQGEPGVNANVTVVTDARATRPSFPTVIWFCPTEPANWQSGDIWLQRFAF